MKAILLISTLLLTGCVVVDNEPIQHTNRIVVVQEYPIINIGVGYNWYRPGPWRHYYQPMPHRHYIPRHYRPRH
jgi:hypothetical protein